MDKEKEKDKPLAASADETSTSTSSSSSPYFQEKYPGKLCCLCNLGERSGLGQGEFLRVKTERSNGSINNDDIAMPSDEFVAEDEEKNSFDEGTRMSGGSTTLPQVSANSACRRIKNATKGKLLTSNESINELDKVGHAEGVVLTSLLDDAYLYVHRMCAMWSLGINRNGLVVCDDGETIVANIETVLAKSLRRMCTFCGMYGASVACRISCMKTFHLPCAAASSCLLIIENFTTFCIDHLSQVMLTTDTNIDCRQCCTSGDISKLVMCSTCGGHYHTTCIGLPNLPDTRSGWNCTQCSKCQFCRLPDSTDGRSVKCEQCQKLYHATCLRPVMSSIPKYGWKCNRCRVCTDCGSRTPGAGTSSRWHCHYTICDSCYQQRNKGFSCPICYKAYRAAANKEMVKCSRCNRFVHSTCDGEADLSVYHKKKEHNPDYDYICPHCKRTGGVANERSSLMGYQKRFGDVTDGNILKDNADGADYFDKAGTGMEYGISEGKPLDAFRNSKKRMGFKELHSRSRGGKLALQRSGMLSQFGRKRGARGKNRHMFVSNCASNIMGGSSDRTNQQRNSTDDEDMAMEKKLLLCSANDNYILSQDICVMCASVGTDQEGCLIACAQCGQCYHPYCVNIKLSKVMLEKGWRCLDCTVCEGCGQKNDEARLILCDECDISYHIYCISPPLDTVPQGNWKCKWCAVCQKCGRKSPGKNSAWRNGFLECGPCASQVACCICSQQYADNELIIQCRNCERWLHCQCDSISNEEEAKLCDSNDYECAFCRPDDRPLPHLLSAKNQLKGASNSKTSSPSSNFGKLSNKSGSTDHTSALLTADGEQNDPGDITTGMHWIDDVCVSEHGLHMIKSLTTEIKRKRKMRPPGNTPKDSGILAAIESVVAGETADGTVGIEEKSENYKDGMIWTGAEGTSPPEGFSISTNDEGINILRKKRQRNLQKLGIGGFNVRNRALKKDAGENDAAATAAVDKCSASEVAEKKKKIVRKKFKNKLSETYPIYLREAFFGKDLLETKNEQEKSTQFCESNSSSDELMNDSIALLYPGGKSKSTTDKDQPQRDSQNQNTADLKVKIEVPDQADVKLNLNNVAINNVAPIDKVAIAAGVELMGHKTGDIVEKRDNLMANFGESSVQQKSGNTFLNLGQTKSNGNIGTTITTDINTSIVPTFVDNTTCAVKVPNSSGLKLQINKNDLGGGMLVPSLAENSKTQLVDSHQQMLQNNIQQSQVHMSHITHSPAPSLILQQTQQQIQQGQPNQQVPKIQQRPSHLKNQVTLPLLPQNTPTILDNASLSERIQQEQQFLQQHQQSRGAFNDCGMKVYLAPSGTSSQTPMVTPMVTPISTPMTTPLPTPTPVEDHPNIDSNVAGTQKTAEKMRRDEDLGDMATISAVLYANTQHPELKQMYPNWNDRCKQILKKWRSLSTERKAPFLQHAKDNRSALRVRRAQQDQEKICFQQKTVKEQEQERIWKQHQAKAKEAATTAVSHVNTYTSGIVPQPMGVGAGIPNVFDASFETATANVVMSGVNVGTSNPLDDKHILSYNSNNYMAPTTPHPNFVPPTPHINASTVYGGSGVPGGNGMSATNAMQRNTAILEQSTNLLMVEKSVNESNLTGSITVDADNTNKQLRTLLLKQEQYTVTDVSSASAQNQGTLFAQQQHQQQQQQLQQQQSDPFKLNLLQDPKNISNIQCNDMKQQQQQQQHQLQQQQNQQTTGQMSKSISLTQSLQDVVMQQDQLSMNLNNKHSGIAVGSQSDLEKLDQAENAGFGDILGGFGEGDDDDLLKSLTAEIGDDFNILEYADPELDELATSHNLLNKLEFDDGEKNT